MGPVGGVVRAALCATEWERAAIVYAFTRDGEPGDNQHTKQVASSSHLSFRQFSELGIVGLRSKDTVARYHRAWAETGRTATPGPVRPAADSRGR